MTTHTRSDNVTAISVSMTQDLLVEVDERAKALGLNRSQYLAQLARADLRERGELTLREAPNSPGQKVAAEVVKLAVAGSQSKPSPKPPQSPTAPVKYKVPRPTKKPPHA